MSLQTAQLGQLPTMNVPYSIPTYDKGPNLWEKALSTLLVSAASQAAQQGIGNALSTDHAAEFGQTPRSGFGRLLNPVVGDDEAKQLRAQKFTGQEAAKQRVFDADQLEQKLMAQQGESETAALNAQARQQDAQAAGLDERFLADTNTQERLRQELAGQETNTRLKAQLESQNPETMARTSLYQGQGRKYNTEAAFQDQMLKMLSSQKGQPALGAASAVTPAMREEATRRQQGAVQQSTRAALPYDQQIQSLIQDMAEAPVATNNTTTASPQLDPTMLAFLAAVKSGVLQ